jgi:hypothetical protein
MQGSRPLLKLLVAAMLAAPAVAVQADIYRYVDADGKVHFTNVPSDRRYKLYLATEKEPGALARTISYKRTWSPPRANTSWSRRSSTR